MLVEGGGGEGAPRISSLSTIKLGPHYKLTDKTGGEKPRVADRGRW